jgi:hypothetical protein
MALLYGRAGCLTAKNGGSRPGQVGEGTGTAQDRPRARPARAAQRVSLLLRAVEPVELAPDVKVILTLHILQEFFKNSDIALHISLANLYTKYKGRRQNDLNVYA